MSEDIVVRWIEEEDLEFVVDAEAEFNSAVDNDFGVPTVHAYAWHESDYLAALKQRKNSTTCTWDTRTLVAEVPVDVSPATGNAGDCWGWPCGVLVYELQPDAYEILNLAVHPEAPEGTLEALVDKLLSKAHRSDKRKKVVAYVSDHHYPLLKWWQDLGAEVSLARDHFRGGTDGWKCVYVAESVGPGPKTEKSGAV